jgi:MerR family transcriptional regulator, thiopeptide resistance regulator
MTRTIAMHEVCRRTGLTPRALRFYEQQGLLAAERSASGRRSYTAAQLDRLRRIVVLKRAGFTLQQIAALLGSAALALQTVLDAQIETLKLRQAQAATALAMLEQAREALDRGGSLDVEALCELIRLGETTMSDTEWKNVIDRYYTPEEQEHWRRQKQGLAPGFDASDYERRWSDLGRRIDAALPMDPTSQEALAFLDEWQRLLQPFTAVADPTMMAGATRLWEQLPEWERDVRAPFSSRVYQFMTEVARTAGKAETTKR